MKCLLVLCSHENQKGTGSRNELEHVCVFKEEQSIASCVCMKEVLSKTRHVKMKLKSGNTKKYRNSLVSGKIKLINVIDSYFNFPFK